MKHTDMGTCAFCGYGDGYLGEQGDDSSQVLHSAVRTGEPGSWKYESIPGAEPASYVRWCGHCIGGLKHKWQRYDDTNLRALEMSYKIRLAMDAPRWEFWEMTTDEKAKVKEAGRYPDDPAIHLDKLHIERDLEDIANEQMRRAGFDLTTHGWRP